jgi:hypothetical protein
MSFLQVGYVDSSYSAIAVHMRNCNAVCYICPHAVPPNCSKDLDFIWCSASALQVA